MVQTEVLKTINVLFCRADSVYRSLPGVDVWDEQRDARNFSGRGPVVAHPPCRLWGVLRQFSTAPAEEKALATWALDVVRRNGGVLEHPIGSSLWKLSGMPHRVDPLSWNVNYMDEFGGWFLDVNQYDYGHKAAKRTRFYICGIARRLVITTWPSTERPKFVVRSLARIVKGHPKWRPGVSRAEREHTPLDMAKWLVSVARRCQK